MPDNRLENSEHLTHVIGKMPSSVIWRANWFIVLLIVSVVVASAIVRLPKVIEGQVVIEKMIPATVVIPATAGQVDELFVQHGDTVNQGQPLFTFGTMGDYNKLLSLEDKIKVLRSSRLEEVKVEDLPEDNFGELNMELMLLKKKIDNYQFLRLVKKVDITKEKLREEIAGLAEEVKILQENIKIYKENLKANRKLEDIDSILFSSKVLSEKEFLEKGKEYKSIYLGYKNLLLNYTTKIEEKKSKERQIEYLEQDLQVDLVLLKSEIDRLLEDINIKIKEWNNQHVIYSPVDGRVNLIRKNFKTGYYIVPGEEVLSIEPKNGNFIGYAHFSGDEFGLIKNGQVVQILLKEYPYQKFGVLEGSVKSFALTEEDGLYRVEIEVKNRLVTSHEKELKYIPRMGGVARVVVEDVTLFKRIFSFLEFVF